MAYCGQWDLHIKTHVTSMKRHLRAGMASSLSLIVTATLEAMVKRWHHNINSSLDPKLSQKEKSYNMCWPFMPHIRRHIGVIVVVEVLFMKITYIALSGSYWSHSQYPAKNICFKFAVSQTWETRVVPCIVCYLGLCDEIKLYEQPPWLISSHGIWWWRTKTHWTWKKIWRKPWRLDH